MNTFPVTILDNFINNPNAIRKWALSLDYHSSLSGNYPGKRTKCLSTIHPGFYNEFNLKILSLFFNIEGIEYKSNSFFHLSKNLEGTGWIHRDDNIILTCILYLSPSSNINQGTSFYKLKPNLIHHLKNKNDFDTEKYMSKHYLTGKLSKQEYQTKEEYEKTSYDKILDIKDEYNRFISFDPVSLYHANNNISPLDESGRLTLITFFQSIKTFDTFPVLKSKQLLN